MQPVTNVLEVVCADVGAHAIAKEKTANLSARDEYLVSSDMHANRTFHNDTEQPTRQDTARLHISSHHGTNVYAALRCRYDWLSYDVLSSDHCLIVIAILFPTMKLSGD